MACKLQQGWIGSVAKHDDGDNAAEYQRAQRAQWHTGFVVFLLDECPAVKEEGSATENRQTQIQNKKALRNVAAYWVACLRAFRLQFADRLQIALSHPPLVPFSTAIDRDSTGFPSLSLLRCRLLALMPSCPQSQIAAYIYGRGFLAAMIRSRLHQSRTISPAFCFCRPRDRLSREHTRRQIWKEKTMRKTGAMRGSDAAQVLCQVTNPTQKARGCA